LESDHAHSQGCRARISAAAQLPRVHLQRMRSAGPLGSPHRSCVSVAQWKRRRVPRRTILGVMTMPSSAKKTFDRNIQRAGYFLDIHEATQPGAGAPTLPRRELPRGAIVFAVGAIDCYLAELSAEVLLRQLAAASPSAAIRTVLERIGKEIPTLALEIALLPTQKERLTRLQESIASYFTNQTSNHGARAVSETVNRIGARANDLWSAMGSRGFDDPQGVLDRWTLVRHQVVHQGGRPKVGRPDARTFLAMVTALVEEVDRIAGRC
jgi:hypothetical protein